jgi:hypothetical protein
MHNLSCLSFLASQDLQESLSLLGSLPLDVIVMLQVV